MRILARSGLVGTSLLGLLALAGCEATEPETAGAAPALRVGGSEPLLKRLVPALLDTWKRTHPDVTVSAETLDAALAIRKLSDRELDVVASTRDARPSEEEQAEVLGYSLRGEQSRHIIAVDVVALAVHPSNPLQSLTYDQVIGVFCSRSTDRWSFLGGGEEPIRVIVPNLESGERALFEDFFCGPKGFFRQVEVASDEAIRQALGSDPNAISFVSASNPAGRLLALQADSEMVPVKPSQDQIIRGAYPLYNDLYLFTRGAPSGLAAEFLSFVESPAGQEVVDEHRLVPLFLRPERMDEPRPLRETVHFEPGSAEPDQRSQARLTLLVQELKERGLKHVVLEGYTDDQEPDAIQLSEQRAQKVRDRLSAELSDIKGLYFEIIPRGPKNPIAPNETPYGRQVNRRVQIYLGEDERQEAAPAEGATAQEG